MMSNYFYQGINFHYEVEGEDYPFMFFHGLGGDWTQCQTTLQHVHGFRKILMDAHGHGTTNPFCSAKNLNFIQFAEDAISLSQKLGCEQLIVGGIPMGSTIALKMTLMYPFLIKALILIRPAWLNRPKPNNLKVLMTIGELLQKYSLETGKSSFLDSEEYAFFKETAPAVANSLIGQFDVHNAKEYAIRLIKIPSSTPFDDDKDLC